MEANDEQNSKAHFMFFEFLLLCVSKPKGKKDDQTNPCEEPKVKPVKPTFQVRTQNEPQCAATSRLWMLFNASPETLLFTADPLFPLKSFASPVSRLTPSSICSAIPHQSSNGGQLGTSVHKKARASRMNQRPGNGICSTNVLFGPRWLDRC